MATARSPSSCAPGGVDNHIAAVLPGKHDNVGRQTLLVVTTVRDLALRRAMLPERRTGTTLGDMQLRSHLLNAGTATRGAYALLPRMGSPSSSLPTSTASRWLTTVAPSGPSFMYSTVSTTLPAASRVTASCASTAPVRLL